MIRRTLAAPGTFDRRGFLAIGLAGRQPALAEAYICTGSLYLCCTAFLPLGLPPAAAPGPAATCPPITPSDQRRRIDAEPGNPSAIPGRPRA